MTERRQKHIVAFTARQMFDLVADIERYPEFVPHCKALRILGRGKDAGLETIRAQMVIQYKMFREQFRCKVMLNPEKQEIHVEYVDGPVKRLNNHWKFIDIENNQSEVDFYIDFQFKSFVFQQLGQAVFDRAFTYMSTAFVARAEDVYGGTAKADLVV